MLKPLKKLFAPAPAIERLSEDQIQKKYPKFRWQILEATFIGYATFYLVRNNFPVVSKELGLALGYDKAMIGNLLAVTAISYGLGKFLMGMLSDRSNPRIFMATGLMLTAIINILFGQTEDYTTHLILWGLNGLVQGMGWPPCGRSLGHWFSVSERGSVFAVWNVAHNVGGAAIAVIAAYSASIFGLMYAFYVPAAIALAGSLYLFWRLRDTPQSVGLPPVEEYKNDYPDTLGDSHDREKELKTTDLLFNYVLFNKYIWLFCAANFFVYIVRYSLLDWGPTYLKEAKGADITEGGWSGFIFEASGIISTILLGWLSDKAGGRRAMVSLLCMVPILGAFVVILQTPAGHLWLDLTMFGVIGFFIYPPVMFLGVMGLDFTSKKAVGAAAGFIGLFGYIGRTVQGKYLGVLSEQYGWTGSIGLIIISIVATIIILSFAWNLKPQRSS